MTSKYTAQVAQPRCRGQPESGDDSQHPTPLHYPEGSVMIRSIVTATAVTALVLLGAGVATAATPEEIAAQCARATIPTALCNGTGGTTDIDGSGRVGKVDKPAYYSGNQKNVVIGYDENKPLTNEDGTPKLDADGDQMYQPIMAPGDPIFTAYPNLKAGDRDADGNVVVDFPGYQAK